MVVIHVHSTYFMNLSTSVVKLFYPRKINSFLFHFSTPSLHLEGFVMFNGNVVRFFLIKRTIRKDLKSDSGHFQRFPSLVVSALLVLQTEIIYCQFKSFNVPGLSYVLKKSLDRLWAQLLFLYNPIVFDLPSIYFRKIIAY